MKAVFDEGVPRQLIPALHDRGCVVGQFPNNWKGLKNGALLDRMERAGVDCLITCDKNLEWQQSLRSRRVGILVLPVQDLDYLRSIAEEIAAALQTVRVGEVVHVSGRRP